MNYTQDIKPGLRATCRRTINVRALTKQEFDDLKEEGCADWLFFEEVWTVYKQHREKTGEAIAL